MKTNGLAGIPTLGFKLYSWALRLALIGMLLLAGVSTARADDVNFLLTDGNGNTMTWTLPSMPTNLAAYNSGAFFLQNVPVYVNGSLVSAGMAFYTNNDGTAGCEPSFCTDTGLFDTFGYQVFSGPTSGPTFTPGIYTEPAEDEVTENDGDTWSLSSSGDVPLTLKISTPEPSSMLLLGSGLLALMGVARRKRFAYPLLHP